MAEWPSIFAVSTKPSAVIGLTKLEAPTSEECSPSGRHIIASAMAYWLKALPGTQATRWPISALAMSLSPVAITVPAPSLPAGRRWPWRPFWPERNGSGMVATTLPGLYSAVSKSAAEVRIARSEGLIGAASILTST